ncbi:MAG: PD-(D/E)XK nuclease family protein [Anaerolineae bacterium]|nr:PD-(D/E)XK nuclease family protein [Anaerolineae bacterium]
MIKQPIPLTPIEVRVLTRCPLHYHFLQQKPSRQANPAQEELAKLVRETIQDLHAAGGPARLSLEECLEKVAHQPKARQMVEPYYQRLEQDWSQMMAGNETMQLRISIGGVSLSLQATVDRLDKTSDGGILAILFRMEDGPLPLEEELRQDRAMTIYHALVAATYPLKRPVRIQEWWLTLDQRVTIELSEEEFRGNLSDLREPVQALARGEVMARPGLHCDTCPFKYHGCPVYTHETDAEAEASQDEASQAKAEDFASAAADGKISPRTWIFKI